jgi:hypothetical protein
VDAIEVSLPLHTFQPKENSKEDQILSLLQLIVTKLDQQQEEIKSLKEQVALLTDQNKRP